MDYAKWCRICSVEVKCGVFLFGEEARKSFLHSKIRRYLSVTITLQDQLPKMICEDCIYKINGFHRFATMALKNQERMTKFVLAGVTNTDLDCHSPSLKDDNSASLLHSYLTNGLSIKKEHPDEDNEVTEVEVRIDPMAILQCCLEDEDSQSEPDEDERSEECVTMEGLEDADDDIFSDNNDTVMYLKNKETITENSSNDKENDIKEVSEAKIVTRTQNGERIHKSDSESTQDNSSDEDSENTRIIYLCSICNRNFDSEIILQHHVQLHKNSHANELINFPKENIIKCKSNMPVFLPVPLILPRVYINEQQLVPKTPNPNGQHCPICARPITSAENLKIHLESHRPKGQYACDICGRVFKTEINLDKHKEYHGGIQYKCDVCGRVYPTNSTLRAHSITHSDLRPHKCPLCDKTFKRNQDLKFHINQHTGARPYQCPYCPKAFASSGNCFSHRKRMHPVEVERDKERAAKIMR